MLLLFGCADEKNPVAVQPPAENSDFKENVIVVPARSGDFLLEVKIDIYNPPLIQVYRLRDEFVDTHGTEPYLQVSNPLQITEDGVVLSGDTVERKYIVKIL